MGFACLEAEEISGNIESDDLSPPLRGHPIDARHTGYDPVQISRGLSLTIELTIFREGHFGAYLINVIGGTGRRVSRHPKRKGHRRVRRRCGFDCEKRLHGRCQPHSWPNRAARKSIALLAERSLSLRTIRRRTAPGLRGNLMKNCSKSNLMRQPEAPPRSVLAGRTAQCLWADGQLGDKQKRRSIGN